MDIKQLNERLDKILEESPFYVKYHGKDFTITINSSVFEGNILPPKQVKETYTIFSGQPLKDISRAFSRYLYSMEVLPENIKEVHHKTKNNYEFHCIARAEDDKMLNVIFNVEDNDKNNELYYCLPIDGINFIKD